MKTNDIRRIIDTGLANVTTTPQDVDAVMEYVRSGVKPNKAGMKQTACKKKTSNGTAKGGESVNHNDNRLRAMSYEEILAYYDQAAPVSDAEVQEGFGRITPRISCETASVEHRKQSHRVRGKIGKSVLVAVCLTLLLSVVAQAFGINLWQAITSWTSEHLIINIDRTENPNLSLVTPRKELTEAEIRTWGKELCNALSELEFFPPLPEYKPEGLALTDIAYSSDEFGRISICVGYADDQGNDLVLMVEKLASAEYEEHYSASIEKDQNSGEEFFIDGMKYFFATNAGSNSYVWYFNDVIYYLFTSYERDVVMDMLSSIKYVSYSEKFADE